ncbi:MAG TPA: ABC transporter permease [Oculatellaceae cyanobacterium]
MSTANPLQNNSSRSNKELARFWQRKNVQRAVIFLGLLALWQGYVWITGISPMLFPGPVVVLQTLISETIRGKILAVTFSTLLLLFQGLAIGAVLGTALAILARISRFGQTLVEVLSAIFSPLPGVALLPLVMIWFGFSSISIIIAVVHTTMWPIALNTDTGFGTINPTILMVGRNLGLDKRRQVTDVMLPAALPSILTGIRSAWAFGWRTVVAAELVFGVAGSTAGLGWYINDSRYYLKTPNVFAGLIAIAILGIVLDSIFLLIEKRTVEKWGMKRS